MTDVQGLPGCNEAHLVEEMDVQVGQASEDFRDLKRKKRTQEKAEMPQEAEDKLGGFFTMLDTASGNQKQVVDPQESSRNS